MATKSFLYYRKKPPETWPQQIIEKKLWEVFSAYIRLRDDFICVTCGKDKGIMQCGHLISRKKLIIKYNTINNHCQCSGCNSLHRYEPDHYINWFIKNYGPDKYDRLVRVYKSARGFSPSKFWYVRKYKYFKIKLEQERELKHGIRL